MKDTHPSYAATSVVSLIAITAGTVSAALLIMFAGIFLTLMSIGATSQTTASLSSGTEFQHTIKNEAIRTVSVQGIVRDSSQRMPIYQKGHLMDALLREENTHSMISSGHSDQAMAHKPHVYAISTIVKFSSHEVYLVQI